jgi:hypothetical protein
MYFLMKMRRKQLALSILNGDEKHIIDAKSALKDV